MKLSIAHLLAAVAWVILPVGYLAPKGEAALFTVAAVVALFVLWRDRGMHWPRPAPLSLAAAAIAALAVLSAIWSVLPSRSLTAGLILIGTGIGVSVLVRGAALMTATQARWLEKVALVAITAGLLWLAVDHLSGGLITAGICALKGWKLVPGEDPRRFLTNGASVAAILVWPWSVMCARRFGAAAAAAALAALVVVLGFGAADTTPLALLAGGAAAATTLTAPRFARAASTAVVVLMMLGAPLLPRYLPDPTAEDPLTTQLPDSVLHRILIWQNTVGEIASRPLLGHGFDSSRALYGADSRREYRLSGRAWSLNAEPIPLHPHNAPLQIWLELGAVGACAFAALLVALTRRVFAGPVDRAARAASVGMLFTGLVIANLSYGAWQSWWLGALGLAAALMVAVGRRSEEIDQR